VGQLGALRFARRPRRVQNHCGFVTGARCDGRRRTRATRTARAPANREVERHLALLEQHVHRHHHAARPQHAVVDDGELRHVREHDPDAIAGVQAAGAQRRGDPGARRIELGVGDDHVTSFSAGRGPCRSADATRFNARFWFIGVSSGVCAKTIIRRQGRAATDPAPRFAAPDLELAPNRSAVQRGTLERRPDLVSDDRVAQARAGQLLEAREAIAHRVGMHEQPLRRPLDVEAALEVRAQVAVSSPAERVASSGPR